MCGIVGGYSFTGLNQDQCEESLTRLYFRGPDFQKIDYFNNNSLFLGHTRLKIIDLSDNSNQPFSSPCGRFELVFNGEIFNYKELKEGLKEFQFHTDGDTEVLLNLYQKYGFDMLHKINGMFAFAIYDKEQEKIFIARDRFGIKQLYYYQENNCFYFASEIKALLPFLKEKKADNRTIKTYLETALYDFGKNTFFESIKRLEASHYLVYSLKQSKIQEITKWYFIEKNIVDIHEEDLEEILYEKIDNAITRHLVSDVNVGLNVSGGLDSSALIYFTNKHLSSINTFTQEYTNYSEKKWIEKVIENYNVKSHFVNIEANDILDSLDKVIKYEDEPFGGVAVVGYSFLYSLAEKHNITVLLDGNGVDEIFLGYKKYHLEYLKDNPNLISEYCNFWNDNPNKVKKQLESMNGSVAIDGSVHQSSSISKELLSLQSYTIPTVDIFDDRVKNLAFKDLIHTKIPRGLRFNDRISMMYSKELRVPFLDYELVEFAYSLPMDRLINKNGTKAILRELMSKKIDSNVAFASKRSIQTPQNDWLANEFKFLVDEILESKSFKERGWINIDMAKKMYKEYLNGDKSNSFFIWQWLNLELWARVYLDN